MVRPLRLALLAGAAALSAVTLAAPPASAQFAFGLFGGGPSFFEEDDYYVHDRFLPPRVISRIVAAQGYRLASAPRLSGDNVIAIGQNAEGARVRFVIDGYSGQLLRRTALGRETFAARQNPDDIRPEGLIPGAGPLPGLEPEAAPAAKPKPKKKPAQTAARKPAAETAPKPHVPAPSQAVKPPETPAPAAEPQKAAAPPADEPKSAAAPAAPQPADKTPLAPDAAAQPKPEAAPATPAPQQAAVPTTPAPAEKPPLTPEAKAPETTAPADKPAETRTSEAKPASEEPAAKPADIGPRVVPVARPVEAAGDAKPAEKGAQ